MAEEGKCSQCDIQVSTDNKQYKKSVELFKYKFPNPLLSANVNSAKSVEDASGTSSTICVTMLNGEFTSLPFNPSMTIIAVKEHVWKELKVPLNRQRLLLNGKELEVKQFLQLPYIKCLVRTCSHN